MTYKNNLFKKILAALLAVCMMASFAGCKPGEANPTETGSVETTQPMESTVATETEPAEETTIPTENVEGTSVPDETAAPETEETVPAVTENEGTEATEQPTEVPVVTYTETDQTVYATTMVYIRSGPSTKFEKLGVLTRGQSIVRIGIGDNGWSRVLFDGKTAYMYSDYLSTEQPADDSRQYPLSYSDATCSITITREWYENAWCYIAHLQFSDYTRFGTACANGGYGSGYETTSHAANRLGAIFAVNGCYSAPSLNYVVVRSGELCNGSGRNLWTPAVYSSQNGMLQSAWETGGTPGIAGKNVDALVESGTVTDTFCFGPPILVNGTVCNASDTSRAQRTFIGTNGNPGEIWIVVSEGRYADDESGGLTYAQCARLLADKGCTFGVPLDGGGSSTMVFQGEVLNSADGNQRAVVDFVYLK